MKIVTSRSPAAPSVRSSRSRPEAGTSTRRRAPERTIRSTARPASACWPNTSATGMPSASATRLSEEMLGSAVPRSSWLRKLADSPERSQPPQSQLGVAASPPAGSGPASSARRPHHRFRRSPPRGRLCAEVEEQQQPLAVVVEREDRGPGQVLAVFDAVQVVSLLEHECGEPELRTQPARREGSQTRRDARDDA